MRCSNGFRYGAWLAVAAVALVGCSPSEVTFQGNLPFVEKQLQVKQEEQESDKDFKERLKQREGHQQDVANILGLFFGTPDEPQLPVLADVDFKKVVDLNKIKMSAGAVKSDKSGNPAGLYREHCVHCHGITGDGLGPTAAFLNPYPRDYRMGTFKFKSTQKGQRPTHADLTRILTEGVPGTAMPSFNVLDKDEIESLVQYVRYLAIRGEVERNLILEVATELGEEDRLVSAKNEEMGEKFERLVQITTTVVQKWIDAGGQGVPVTARPAEWDTDEQALRAAVVRGRELFYGNIANCVKCHGDSALGDGQTADFDEWTKELEPANVTRLGEYLKVGALPPRNIRPRNLRLGNYRGGRRPVDLYWRIANGIDGTPMPAVPKQTPENAKGLTSEDVWCLVEYVRHLPYETMSQVERHQPTNVRERN